MVVVVVEGCCWDVKWSNKIEIPSRTVKVLKLFWLESNKGNKIIPVLFDDDGVRLEAGVRGWCDGDDVCLEVG